MKIPRSAALLAALGFEIAFSVLGGLGLGYLLDVRLDTSPWFLLGGCVVGAAVATTRLVSWTRRVNSERRLGDREGRGGDA